jgi:hypothetical protein
MPFKTRDELSEEFSEFNGPSILDDAEDDNDFIVETDFEIWRYYHRNYPR